MSTLLGRWIVIAALLCAGRDAVAQAKTLASLDLTDAAQVGRWQPTHDVSRIEATPEGMAIHISGPDPYIMGPSLGVPAGELVWLRMKLRSEVGGAVQVFYFEDGPTEARSASASVPPKKWTEVSMPLPALSPRTRVRVDPPGVSGVCTIAWLRVDQRRVIPTPRWSKPPAIPTAGSVSIRSGNLVLSHAPRRAGSFVVSVDGYAMATGWSRLPVAYMVGDNPRWTDLAARGAASVRKRGTAIEAILIATDPDGARWTIRQTFAPARLNGVIDTTTEITVNKPRTVYFLPMLALFPGHTSFGSARERAVFPGLEYLDPPDRSSSEADLRGEQAKRLVPDTLKVTFPLMAMQAKQRYVGLIWTMKPWFAPAFDTPDRSFGSGANAMGLLFPGSDGVIRSEGSLIPYQGRLLEAGYRLTLNAQIIGGRGTSVIPAIQRYVTLKGLPPVPPTGMDSKAFARWLAGGWLDSKISEGSRYRHAYWPGWTSFAPHPAADPATWMLWCMQAVQAPALQNRLSAKIEDVLNLTDPSVRNDTTVSHVTYPVQTLLFGGALQAATRAANAARQALERFGPDGTITYTAPPGAVDYGATHFEKHANGLTAQVLSSALVNSLVSGDRALMQSALLRLRDLDRYRDTAPRGAQTWEVPLHTPDILASAHLVKAYTIGYEMTGESRYLDMARHWAWTGIPFVYLVKPVPEPIGLYATIPVYGATNWVAPNWMGLPVQWCGLVYSDALYRLARYDRTFDWRRVADGISASGVQQSWPTSDQDLQALLPDSVTLRSQNRNAVAINPGTVQANAIRLFGGPEVYDYHVFRKSGHIVHAPGEIRDAVETSTNLSFRYRHWANRPVSLLICGLKKAPTVRMNDQLVQLKSSDYDPETGHAVIPIAASAGSLVKVTVTF